MAGQDESGLRPLMWIASDRSRWAGRGLLACAAITAGAFAQLGDAAGERQVPIVPAEQIPPAPAVAPAATLRNFVVAPGYQLELVASEPLVQDPVAMAFGPDGRLWVVEMRGFMPDLDGTGEDQPTGRVVVLQDRDGDGRYDDSQVFLDQLVLPRAILLVAGGVLVGAPPELAFWRDTDGDGKADRKEVLATDYGVKVDPQRPFFANPELAPNALLWAQDNWIYSAAYPKKFRYGPGGWQTAATPFRGQWGLTQDDYGRLYHNSNADQLRVDLIFPDYLQRNPHYPRLAGANVNAAADQLVWPARVTPGLNRGYRPEVLRDGRLRQFTAACAPWIYEGDLLPELRGNIFVAEPAANFVRRNVLTLSEGAPRAHNAYERAEFIASTDERFRPVNFATGPDGALYLVDFYRGVLQHRLSLTTYLRKQSLERKLIEPQHLGRIYRVIAAGSRPARATRIAPLTPAAWADRLADPNGWWRETAQRMLVETRDPAAIPRVRAVAASGEPAGRVRALWTLEGMGALESGDVLAALAAPADPRVLTAAIRLAEGFLAGEARADMVRRLSALLNHGSTEVRRQAVLSLAAAGDPAVDRLLAQAVRAHPRTDLLREALYSGLTDRELPLLESLLADPAWPVDTAADEFLGGLAQGILGSRELPAIERVLALVTEQSGPAPARASALLDGLHTAASAERRPLRFSRPPAGWAPLEKIPVYRARLAQLGEKLHWPGKPGADADVSPRLSAAQQKRFSAGRPIFTAVCAACHQASGAGLDGLAPPLLDSEWVLGSPERLVRVVLQGLSGPIKVRGRTYAGDMPAFGGFADEDLAAVLTYIRQEWGHAASPIEPAQIASIRAAAAGHYGAWSAEELRWIK